MTVADLSKLMQNRIAALNGQRNTAVSVGDVEQILVIDGQIEATQITLDQLKTLLV